MVWCGGVGACVGVVGRRRLMKRQSDIYRLHIHLQIDIDVVDSESDGSLYFLLQWGKFPRHDVSLGGTPLFQLLPLELECLTIAVKGNGWIQVVHNVHILIEQNPSKECLDRKA